MASNENFYKRIREIAGIKTVNESKKETKNTTLVDVEIANNGTAYGIVKENHHYYIKKSQKNEANLGVTDFVFIDGVENKTKYQYNSLGEAEKQRNFYVKGINEAFDQGGVYNKFKNEFEEAPSLKENKDFSSFIKNRINEGKKNIKLKREEEFKSRLSNNSKNLIKKNGLMPESANIAVKKALGVLNEEDLSTADSEIDTSNAMPNHVNGGKEQAQAPINDTNAKSNADRGLSQPSDVSTSDSEIEETDVMPNRVNAGKEQAQAPINDTNAKSNADKNNATSSNVNEDEKKGDPLNNAAKVNSGNDDVTSDSDITDADRVDNETSVEKPQSHDTHYDPEMGHKENKGETLKPKESKKDIVAESEFENSMDDKEAEMAAKKDIEDSEIEAANALADLDFIDLDNDAIDESKESSQAPINDTNAKTHADKAMGKGNAKETLPNNAEKSVESDPYVDKKDKGSKKTDIVSENDDLTTSDSEINVGDNEKNNLNYSKPKNEKGTSDKMDDNAISESDENVGDDQEVSEDVDDDINAASDAVKNLDTAKDSEPDENVGDDQAPPAITDEPEMSGDEETESEPEMSDSEETESEPEMSDSEETDSEPEMSDSEETESEPEMSDSEETDSEPEMSGDEEETKNNAGDDLVVKEIEKLVGKTTQKIRSTDLEPNKAEGFLKSIVSAFEDKMSDLDLDDRKEISDKIINPDEEESDNNEKSEIEDEEYHNIEDSGEEEETVEEDAPMKVNGEMRKDGEELNFESYMESRGYSSEDLEECSDSEMANLVSGYISDKENILDNEVKEVAKYMNEKVCDELNDYGHETFSEMVKPHIKEGGAKFGSFEPMLSGVGVSEGEKEDMDGDGDIDSEDYLAKKDAAIKKSMAKNEGEKEDMDGDGDIDFVDYLAKRDAAIDKAMAKNEDDNVGFSNDAEVMGGGVVKPETPKNKTVEIDVNSGKVKLEVNEERIRKYVRNRLEELSGKKKVKMNESSKSENLKKLDRLIESQWKLFGKNYIKG